MKFGICASPDSVATLAPGSIDYIELSLGWIAGITSEEFGALKKRLSDIGTPAEASNCFFPGSVRLCGAEYDPKTIAAYTENALARAAELGIFTCVLGSGNSRNVTDGDDRDECISQFEEALSIVGNIAMRTGTTVVIEPLRAKETNLVNTVSEGAEICRRVDHPNIRLLADYFHVVESGEGLGAIVENRDLIRHIHIAAPISRRAPSEDDGHDYSPFVEVLKRAGYDLRVSIEGNVNGDFSEIVPRSIAYLRRIFA